MEPKIQAHELETTFPGNALNAFTRDLGDDGDNRNDEVADAFDHAPTRRWVAAAVQAHAAGLPRPKVPAQVAERGLELTHRWNLGGDLEQAMVDAIALTPCNVLQHVERALDFDAASVRRVALLQRAAPYLLDHLADVRRTAAWQRCQDSPESARAVADMLCAALSARLQRGEFAPADDAESGPALAAFLMEQLPVAQWEPLTPWLLRADDVSSQAILAHVRDSFAAFRTQAGDAQAPSVFAAARGLQTWFCRMATQAHAAGLPSSERLRQLMTSDPLGFAAGANLMPVKAPKTFDLATLDALSPMERFLRIYDACECLIAPCPRTTSTTQALLDIFFAAPLEDRDKMVEQGSWFVLACRERPGLLAKMVESVSPRRVKTLLYLVAGLGGAALLAEWVPLLPPSGMQQSRKPSKAWTGEAAPEAAALEENLRRFKAGWDGLMALPAHYPRPTPVDIVLHAGLQGLAYAAPGLGMNLRQALQRDDVVVQALFFVTAPQNRTALMALVAEARGTGRVTWRAPLPALVAHAPVALWQEVLQALPPTPDTLVRLFEAAAKAERPKLMALIWSQAEDPRALVQTACLRCNYYDHGESEQGRDFGALTSDEGHLLDVLDPTVQTSAFMQVLDAMPQEKRTAIHLPRRVTACVLRTGEPALLQRFAKRVVVTADDWWNALHLAGTLSPGMARAAATCMQATPLDGAMPRPEGVRSGFRALAHPAERSRVLKKCQEEANGPVGMVADDLHLLADHAPNLKSLQLCRLPGSYAPLLARFAQLQALCFVTLGDIDLSQGVAQLAHLERLTIYTSSYPPEVIAGWPAVAALRQLQEVRLEGRVQDGMIDGALAAGLAPRLNLSRASLSQEAYGRAIAAMQGKVLTEHLPCPPTHGYY